MNILPVLHPLFHSFPFLRRKSLLIADISSEAIRLSVFTRKKKTLQIAQQLTQALPNGCVSQQRIIDKRQFLEALSPITSQLTLSIKSYLLILALPINHLKMKTLALSFPLSKKEIESQVQREIRALINHPENTVCWDHRIVRKVEKTSLDILIVQRSTLLPYQEIFSQIGLPITIVDSESEALIRAWQFCYPDTHEAIVVLARAQLLTLVLIQSDDRFLSRAQLLNPLFTFEQAFLEAFQQLQNELSLDTIYSTKILICGEKAQEAEHFLKQKWGHKKVSQVTLPDSVKCDPTMMASELFLSVGLSLHQDCQ